MVSHCKGCNPIALMETPKLGCGSLYNIGVTAAWTSQRFIDLITYSTTIKTRRFGLRRNL